MSEHGGSTLAADEAGRILDRLAGLEKVISPELVRQVLAQTGKVNGRACVLTHEVMVWIVLAMGLSATRTGYFLNSFPSGRPFARAAVT